MASSKILISCVLLAVLYLAQASPIPKSSSREVEETTAIALPAETTAIDTLNQDETGVRVKRQGGCGCCGCGCGCGGGCGCCCCRPRCCCRCCCCRTCCCTRCCTCCRPCCCGCGCGCCGCGGGRKRRALQTLRIQHINKVEKENKVPALPEVATVLPEVAPALPEVAPAVETTPNVAPEATTEWPEPVFELVTETTI